MLRNKAEAKSREPLVPTPRSDRAYWVPDSARKGCGLCGRLFGSCRPRHHCRSCGDLCCHDCSTKKFSLVAYQNKAVRVCDDCFDAYRNHTHMTGEKSDVNMNKNLLPPKDYPAVARWVTKGDAHHCGQCTQTFTCCRKMYNCYSCGLAFCANCSSQRRRVGGYDKLVRVCDPCALQRADVLPSNLEINRDRFSRYNSIETKRNPSDPEDANLAILESNVPRGIEIAAQLLREDKILQASQRADAIEKVVGLLEVQLRTLEAVVAERAGTRRPVARELDHIARIRALLAFHRDRKPQLRKIRNTSTAIRALLQQFDSDAGWTRLSEKEGVVMAHRIEDDDTFQTFKTSGEVTGRLDQLLPLLLEPLALKHWLRIPLDCSELVRVQKMQKFTHVTFPLPSLGGGGDGSDGSDDDGNSSGGGSGSSSRDMVVHSHVVDILEHRSLLAIIRSVTRSSHCSIPTPAPGVTRMQIFGGIRFRLLDEGRVEVTAVLNVNLNAPHAPQQQARRLCVGAIEKFIPGIRYAMDTFESSDNVSRFWNEDADGVYADFRQRTAAVIRVLSQRSSVRRSRQQQQHAAAAAAAASGDAAGDGNDADGAAAAAASSGGSSSTKPSARGGSSGTTGSATGGGEEPRRPSSSRAARRTAGASMMGGGGDGSGGSGGGLHSSYAASRRRGTAPGGTLSRPKSSPGIARERK